jgi:hypothetical protein
MLQPQNVPLDGAMLEYERHFQIFGAFPFVSSRRRRLETCRLRTLQGFLPPIGRQPFFLQNAAVNRHHFFCIEMDLKSSHAGILLN